VQRQHSRFCSVSTFPMMFDIGAISRRWSYVLVWHRLRSGLRFPERVDATSKNSGLSQRTSLPGIIPRNEHFRPRQQQDIYPHSVPIWRPGYGNTVEARSTVHDAKTRACDKSCLSILCLLLGRPTEDAIAQARDHHVRALRLLRFSFEARPLRALR
jgi:hypothetical protein